MPRLKLTDAEANLIARYREQAHAFNEGVAACIAHLSEGVLSEYAQGDEPAKEILNDLAKLKKEHG